MKRRAFLGLMGGAAVSGPKLAGSIVDEETFLPSVSNPLMNLGSTFLYDPRESGKEGRIEELRSFLFGDDAELRRRKEHIRISQADLQERMRLDSLRSVSANAKARILTQYRIDLETRTTRQNWLTELNDLLSKV